MTSAFVFAGFSFRLGLVGQSFEIERSDKTGAEIVNSVRQKHSDFATVLSGKIKHAWMSSVITDYTACGKLLGQSLRYRQRLNATCKYPISVKIFDLLFSANIINYLLHAQPEKSAAGPRRQLHKTLSFIENSFCFLRHFLISRNTTRDRPDNLIPNKKRNPSACRTSTNSDVGRIVKLRQVFNVDEICLFVVRISRSSPRFGPITLNELQRFFTQTGAAMRANVFRTKHD